MKKLIQPSYCLLFLLIFLFSCEREVDNLPLPKSDPMLVVNAYLTPGANLVEVHVSKSVPYFGDQSDGSTEPIGDASVTISSGNLSYTLNYNDNFRSYLSQVNEITLTAGSTYQLSVIAPGGFSYNASTTIPSFYPDVEIFTDSVIYEKDDSQYKRYQVITKWNEAVNQKNYYRLSFNNYYSRNNENGLQCDLYIDDASISENTVSRKCVREVFFYDDPFNPIGGSELSFDTVHLLSTDEAYYKYHESLNRYEGEDPFSQPVQVYSNIKGGLGCFGSYIKNSFAVLP